MTEQEWDACQDPQWMLRFFTDPPGGGARAKFRASDRKLRLFAVACCRNVWARLTDGYPRRVVWLAECFADGGPKGAVFEAGRSYRSGSSGVLAKDWIVLACCQEDAGLAALATSREHTMLFDDQAEGRRVQADLMREVFGNPFRAVTYLTRTVECVRCNGKGFRTLGVTCGTCEGSGKIKGNADWLTPQVLALADAAYRDRVAERCECLRGSLAGGFITVDPDCSKCGGTGNLETGSLDPVTLAALADALEEAGCENEDILRHLRGEARCYVAGGVSPDYDHYVWVRKDYPCVRGCHVLDALLGKE